MCSLEEMGGFGELSLAMASDGDLDTEESFEWQLHLQISVGTPSRR
jgi:hypothetical protein